MLSPGESIALAMLRARLVASFGDRLRSLTLFGSRARGEGHEESDLDLLVLIAGLARADRARVLDDVLAVELSTGLALSPLVRDPDAFSFASPIGREIARDGVAV